MEIEAGALLFRAIILKKPARTCKNEIVFTARFRSREGRYVHAHLRARCSEDADKLSALKPGDELFLSVYGDEYSDIIRHSAINRWFVLHFC